MILLAATSLVTSSPSPAARSPTAAVAQATATIRVVTGVVIKLGASTNPDAPPTQETVIHSPDGSVVPAKLVEFQ
jgi:hypothetical protein